MMTTNHKPDTALPQDQVQSLRSYVNQPNNGRGRITGATAKLFAAGYLMRSWTSANCWTLSLSHKGRALLRELGEL